MRIFVNGEQKELAEVNTVAELVQALQLNPLQVAIERNRQIVPRATYADAALAEDDEIEIVRFIGGG
jgi:sulfur carrier protein